MTNITLPLPLCEACLTNIGVFPIHDFGTVGMRARYEILLCGECTAKATPELLTQWIDEHNARVRAKDAKVAEEEEKP